MSIDIAKELSDLKHNKIISESRSLLDTVERYENRNAINEYRIAVVGEYSSGKSTFINSIIGKDILTHAIEETTATITYIRNVPVDDKRENTCIVKFNDGKTEKAGLSSVLEYTTTKSKKHDVASTIDSVEMFVHFVDTDREIVIVDTPGLNGTADKHQDMTIDEIKQAHACIYLLQLRGVSSSDVDFLKLLSKYQYSYIIVQNFIDELKINEESVEGKIAQAKRIIEEKVFGEENDRYRCEYCGISALLALVSKDKNINRLYNLDTADITDSEREKYRRESRYDEFYNILHKLVNDKSVERKIYIDQCRNIYGLLCEAEERGKYRQQDYELSMESDDGYKIIKKAEEYKERLQSQKDEIWEKLSNMIRARFYDARNKLSSYFDEKLHEICEKESEKVENYTDYKTFKSEYDSIIAGINSTVAEFITDLNEYKRKLYQVIYHDVISTMEEYTYITSGKTILSFSVDDKIENQNFVSSDISAKIKYNEKEICREENEIEDKYDRRNKCERDIIEAEADAKSLKNSRDREVSVIKTKINQLGERPDIRWKKIQREEKVEIGGVIGKIGKFLSKHINFISTPTRTRMVTERQRDDTERKKYDAERNKLLDELQRKNTYYDSEIEKNRKKLSGLKNKEEELDIEINISERRKRSLKEKIRRLEEDQRIYEEKARKEYLNMRKKALVNDIEEYIISGDKSVLNVLRYNLSDVEIEANINIVLGEVKKQFNERIAQKEQMYSSLITLNMDEIKQKYKDYSNDLEEIVGLKRRIEEELTNESV